MKSTPKHFAVEWIPEAAGRDLVKQLALIVRLYKDSRGMRLDNLTLAYQPDGSTIQITLYTEPNSSLAIEAEENRQDEPDSTALPPGPGR